MSELKRAVELLKRLKRNDCWCEMGIGNPMYSGHTKVCKDVQGFLAELKQRRTHATKSK
jgi:hypothetical protein